jgi:hypothetical protein
MTGLIADAADWRRTWTDGRSTLVVEREVDGTVRLAIHDVEWPGYGLGVNESTGTEIAAFITGEP